MVTLKSVSQAMNYACDELFDELPAKKVAIIGSAEAEACEFLQAGLRRQGCEVARFNDFAELDKARLDRLALIFVVVASLPARSLYAQVESLVRRAGSVCLIPVVEYADQEKAATLLELGCVDYLLSPFSETQLGALLRRQVCAETAQESFVSCSQAGRRLLAMAQRVSLTRAPILITGETGTGKELMARYIHRFSASPDAPFVAVNCAAIPEQMLESILFGHEKGAFTGAVSAQPGKFELANGGTLLLDEIGELPLGLQAKLLRVLQEGEVRPLGSTRTHKVDVRIVAATHQDLHKRVEEGRFREDLYYRLSLFPIELPPLRERDQDILRLARHFADKACGFLQRDTVRWSDAALEQLAAYGFPGNVRELKGLVERAVLLCDGGELLPEHFSLRAVDDALDSTLNLRERLERVERNLLVDSLRKNGGNQSQAARELGLPRRTLLYRMERLGVSTSNL